MPPNWSIRLGHKPHDILFEKKSVKGRHCNIARTHENNSHAVRLPCVGSKVNGEFQEKKGTSYVSARISSCPYLLFLFSPLLFGTDFDGELADLSPSLSPPDGLEAPFLPVSSR